MMKAFGINRRFLGMAIATLSGFALCASLSIAAAAKAKGKILAQKLAAEALATHPEVTGIEMFEFGFTWLRHNRFDRSRGPE
jgi:hypothetical protein